MANDYIFTKHGRKLTCVVVVYMRRRLEVATNSPALSGIAGITLRATLRNVVNILPGFALPTSMQGKVAAAGTSLTLKKTVLYYNFFRV